MKIEDGLPDNPMDEPVAVRVARGAALLDEQAPAGWRKLIVPARLNMGNHRCCVVGQLYGSYGHGCAILRITSRDQAIRYGFQVGANSHVDLSSWESYDAALSLEFGRLRDAWVAELAPTP